MLALLRNLLALLNMFITKTNATRAVVYFQGPII
jgi:hypothetical protein